MLTLILGLMKMNMKSYPLFLNGRPEKIVSKEQKRNQLMVTLLI